MTIIYILAAILIFGVLIALHELGHFLAAKASGVQVNEFSIGMGPVLFQRQKGETQYSLRLLPIGGFCAMEGEDEDSDNPRALNRQGFWKKFVIFIAGSLSNFVTGFLILLLLYANAAGFYVPVVASISPEFTAQGGELLEGDVLWAINGERVYLYSDVALLMGFTGEGKTLSLTVLRDGEKVVLTNIPYQTCTRADGQTYQGYGLTHSRQVEPATLGGKLKTTWYNTVDFVRLVRLSLQMLVRGEAGMKDLSGPVGIVSTITQVGEESETARAAVENILYFAALIAVNLAVMNLLPLPALDGGRVLFLVLDAVTMALFRRRIPDRYQAAVNFGGLVVLMGFMLLVTLNDVGKLLG